MKENNNNRFKNILLELFTQLENQQLQANEIIQIFRENNNGKKEIIDYRLPGFFVRQLSRNIEYAKLHDVIHELNQEVNKAL